jgi:hypothetical protein
MSEARTQRLRDPVHGLIVFREGDNVDQFAWRHIGTPEFWKGGGFCEAVATLLEAEDPRDIYHAVVARRPKGKSS